MFSGFYSPGRRVVCSRCRDFSVDADACDTRTCAQTQFFWCPCVLTARRFPLAYTPRSVPGSPPPSPSNQWHRFIQTHGGPEGFELFLVQDGKRAVWRIRLEKHTNYKEVRSPAFLWHLPCVQGTGTDTGTRATTHSLTPALNTNQPFVCHFGHPSYHSLSWRRLGWFGPTGGRTREAGPGEKRAPPAPLPAAVPAESWGSAPLCFCFSFDRNVYFFCSLRDGWWISGG